MLRISGTSYSQAWASFPRGHLSTGYHPVLWAAQLSPVTESVCDYSEFLLFPGLLCLSEIWKSLGGDLAETRVQKFLR